MNPLVTVVAAAAILLVFAGCSTKEPESVADEQRFLSFPVMLSDMDAANNQAQLESRIVARVAMQSAYPQCGQSQAEGTCIRLVALPTPNRYGIDALTAEYYADGSKAMEVRYPVKISKTQSGRAYIVTLKRPENIQGGKGGMTVDAWQLSEPRPLRVR